MNKFTSYFARNLVNKTVASNTQRNTDWFVNWTWSLRGFWRSRCVFWKLNLLLFLKCITVLYQEHELNQHCAFLCVVKFMDTTLNLFLKNEPGSRQAAFIWALTWTMQNRKKFALYFYTWPQNHRGGCNLSLKPWRQTGPRLLFLVPNSFLNNNT